MFLFFTFFLFPFIYIMINKKDVCSWWLKGLSFAVIWIWFMMLRPIKSKQASNMLRRWKDEDNGSVRKLNCYVQ